MIKKRYIKRIYTEVVCCDNCGREMKCSDINKDLLDNTTYIYKCDKCGYLLPLSLDQIPSFPFKYEYEDEVVD